MEPTKYPGGVKLDSSIVNHNSFEFENVSFEYGTISFLNQKTGEVMEFHTGFTENDLVELYDMITNSKFDYLYVDSHKIFTFNCPVSMQDVLFNTEIEFSVSLARYGGKYIGTIDTDDWTLYARPCMRSKKDITFDDIFNPRTNTLSLDFSQHKKIKETGDIFISSDFDDLEPIYQSMLQSILPGFDTMVRSRYNFSKLNRLNKTYQLLCMINNCSSYKVNKVKDSYMEYCDKYEALIGNNGTRNTVRPIGSLSK